MHTDNLAETEAAVAAKTVRAKPKRLVIAVRVLMKPDTHAAFCRESKIKKLSLSNLALGKMGYPLNKVGRKPKVEAKESESGAKPGASSD